MESLGLGQGQLTGIISRQMGTHSDVSLVVGQRILDICLSTAQYHVYTCIHRSDKKHRTRNKEGKNPMAVGR